MKIRLFLSMSFISVSVVLAEGGIAGSGGIR